MDYTKKRHPMGFYQAYPIPSQEELDHYYREEYFQACKSASYSHDYSEEEMQFILIQPVVADYVLKQAGKNPVGKLIDIGCGEGFFARFFYDHGWEIECCDLSSFAIERHNPEILSFFTENNIFKELDEKITDNNKYDFINLSNVLEHVREPVILLERVKKIMGRDAMLRIKVPNDFSAFQQILLDSSRISSEYWFNPPGHLNFFMLTSLKEVLNSCGFHIVKILADFPIELFLLNKYSNYVVDKSKGAEAHNARVVMERYLMDHGTDKYVDFMSISAEVGLGRTIIVFAEVL
jgi:2-polyprenyl-3-methyl-5-hydroxy-6-metoxy-1,4-benzoquinol methylase